MPDSSRDAHVVIGGASGLIGRALVASLEADGKRVTKLVRRDPEADNEVRWLDGNPLSPDVVAGAESVFILNGSSIGALPWTKKRRQLMRQSRIIPRQTAARALLELGADAPHLVHASAVGVYGSEPSGTVTEESPTSSGYIADLARDSERAADLHPISVTHARLGIVLHPDGVLKPLIPLTIAGVAGRLGSGTQSWPWIALPDAVNALRFAADHRLSGPVNLTGLTRATMNDIGFAVARELSKPYLFPVPAWVLRRVLGEDAANNLLLVDAVVAPKVLTDAGFTFTHGSAESAIHESLAPLRLDA